MTNFADNLKKLELHTWENGSAWQRARIAYRHEAMNELACAELVEIVNTLDEMNFYANMSDDWNVTRKEKAENNSIAKAAREELKNRYSYKF